jgi:hypothetical protein
MMLRVLQEASVLLNDVPVAQLVQTVPAIDFDVTAAAASADGHQLLLVGATRQVRSQGLLPDKIGGVRSLPICMTQKQLADYVPWEPVDRAKQSHLACGQGCTAVILDLGKVAGAATAATAGAAAGALAAGQHEQYISCFHFSNATVALQGQYIPPVHTFPPTANCFMSDLQLVLLCSTHRQC